MRTWTPPSSAPAQPHGRWEMFSALRYREFRLVWIGAFTSTTGTWMQTVAQAWVVYSLTGSALLPGPSGAPRENASAYSVR